MPNRLSNSTSPYLLQHAENPVDWFPWEEAAFEKARSENKPIFLSIGYSTCHWCHVMAHESFENPEIAAILNEYFVGIKVDREERPDIDRLYMAFVQATTGSGGWPMSVWLTPEGKPFFGGTYFPPADKFGRTGFVTILERVAEVWAREQARVTEQGEQVIEALREGSRPPRTESVPGTEALSAGLDAFAASYDAERGGFGRGPKFPRPAVIDFLFRMDARETSGVPSPALDMALNTLRSMAAGGLRDHIGGGFHRYAVDGAWRVPHFEKMLYDQAQIACSFLDAWKISGDDAFAAVVRETLGYVRKNLAHPEGGFYSAEDADSLFRHGGAEHGEGAFYVWTAAEIEGTLGPEKADAFCRHYGIEPNGNVDPASDPQGELTGKNIPFQRESVLQTARLLGRLPGEIRPELEESRAMLAGIREQRPRPHLDDKILAAWNGLMISALSRAGAALDDADLLDAASRAARFLRREMVDPSNGELFRSWRGGTAGIRAFAEDYAFVIQGLLDLYEAGSDPAWLAWAQALQEKQDALFFEAETGTYLGSADGDALVPLRMREDYDGAEPAANSISALNLLRLGRMFHDETKTVRAGEVIASFSTILAGMPAAIPKMLCALDMLHSPPSQAVLAEGRQGDAAALALALHRQYRPNRVLLRAEDSEASLSMQPVDGRAAVYLCEDFRCQPPVTDPSEL